jgi:hypothetical protein
MPRCRSLGRRALLGAVAFAVVLPASASAALPRTYVDEDTGTDSNDCTHPTPCLTFQHAHDVTSPGGEINVLGSGNYSSLTITKPITIDGNGTQATMTPFQAGITVNLAEGNGRVVLRDLAINAAANAGELGVDVVRGGTVTLDNVRIFGGSIAGIRVLNSQDAATRLFVDDTRVNGTGGPGVTIEPSGARAARVTVRDSKIDDNSSPGVYAAGIRLKPSSGATARATVRNTQLDANYNGVIADASGGTAVANVLRSAISDCSFGTGIYSVGANATVRLSRNEIQFNKRGLLAASGGKILSTGDNDVFGNTVDGPPTGTFGRQ